MAHSETSPSKQLAPDADRRLQRALARMPARLRKARKLFRELTGFDAVVTLTGAAAELSRSACPRPSVHPTCARRIRDTSDLPCSDHWQQHLRATLAFRRSHSHRCRLGLMCACVPIYLGRYLIGVGKVVVDDDTSPTEFAAATATLGVTIATICQTAYVEELTEDIDAPRPGVTECGKLRPPRAGPQRTSVARPSDHSASVVDLALDHIHRHYQDCRLSLRSIAGALHCNDNYLSQHFTQLVGERMHAYILSLRIERACRELIESDRPLEQIASESGFGGPGRMTRLFHRQVGVNPGEYRRIFSGH